MDIKEIKKVLSNDIEKIEKLLSYFGFHTFSMYGENLRCAVPDGDNPSSVSIKINENLYGNVYTRNVHGDIFHIIKEICSRTIKEILNIVDILFGLKALGHFNESKSNLIIEDISIYKKDKKKKLETVGNKLYDTTILDRFTIIPHKEIYEECISPEVAKMFEIGFDYDRNRIIFPHYDWKNFDKIVGIKGRIANLTTEECKSLGVAKYWNYLSGYKQSQNLYGWKFAMENVWRENKLIIFESEKSVLKQFTIEKGLGYSVALGGSVINKEQIKFIVNNTPINCEVIFAFDKDIMEKKFGLLMQAVQSMAKFRKTSYIFDNIPNYKLLKEYDSPIDRSIKVWKYLFEARVRV